MKIILNIAQLVISALLVLVILLQARGFGLGMAFGGESNVYSTKRGIEKTLFISTIILGVLFFVVSFLSVIIK